MEDINKSKKYNDLAVAIADRITYHTVQLYTNDNNSAVVPPIADSTGVIFTIEGRFFLVTTGHTFYNVEPLTIGVMKDEYFYPIRSKKEKLFEPNTPANYDPRKIDLTIIELEPSFAGFLSETYRFLEPQNIDFYHVNGQSPYIIFGYPERKTKLNPIEKLISPHPLLLRTIAAEDKHYKKMNINPVAALILEVNQKKVVREKTGLMERLPKLNGVSGCGIWGVYSFDATNPEYNLISILTGQNEQRTVIYSTKTSVLLQCLRSFFDHTSIPVL